MSGHHTLDLDSTLPGTYLLRGGWDVLTSPFCPMGPLGPCEEEVYASTMGCVEVALKTDLAHDQWRSALKCLPHEHTANDVLPSHLSMQFSPLFSLKFDFSGYMKLAPILECLTSSLFTVVLQMLS